MKASDSGWSSPIATCTRSRRVAAKHQEKFLGALSRGESSPISVGCVRLPRRTPHVPGKMWDCKTSKMSQSPRAALNAFGLFARMSHCGTRTSRRLTLGVSSRTSDERLPSTSRCHRPGTSGRGQIHSRGPQCGEKSTGAVESTAPGSVRSCSTLAVGRARAELSRCQRGVVLPSCSVASAKQLCAEPKCLSSWYSCPPGPRKRAVTA